MGRQIPTRPVLLFEQLLPIPGRRGGVMWPFGFFFVSAGLRYVATWRLVVSRRVVAFLWGLAGCGCIPASVACLGASSRFCRVWPGVRVSRRVAAFLRGLEISTLLKHSEATQVFINVSLARRMGSVASWRSDGLARGCYCAACVQQVRVFALWLIARLSPVCQDVGEEQTWQSRQRHC